MFLHGIGGNRSHWDDQLAAFAPDFTACAPDARGYGDSDDYDGPLAFGDLAGDLLRVIDHFGAARAHLVGLSLGGRVARDFCLRHPDRVATLVLCNTHAGFDALAPDQVDAFVRSRHGPLAAGRTPRELAPELARNVLGSRHRRARRDAAAREPRRVAEGRLSQDAGVVGAGGSRRRASSGSPSPRWW